MAWVYLILAGLFEIGWPIGLKLAGNENFRWQGMTIAVVCMGVSSALLWVAQKTIPMGTAYSVWTGIGAVGAFVVGVVFYNDALTFMRNTRYIAHHKRSYRAKISFILRK